MLVVTKTETGFSVTSDLLQQFEEGDVFTLTIQQNCCTESETFQITEFDESIDVDSAFIDVEGVYTFNLRLTKEAGDYYFQEICYFNEVDLACRVGQFIIDNCKSDVHFDYFMLINMQNCACDCNNMCTLYKRILSKLKEEFCCDKTTQKPCTSC